VIELLGVRQRWIRQCRRRPLRLPERLRPVQHVRRASWVAGALVLVCILVAGCSSSTDTDAPKERAGDEVDEAAAILEDGKKMGSAQQTEALADGRVTVEEMQASLDALDACLASTDWHLEDVYPDPIRGEPHFSYSMVSERPGSDDAEMNECDVRTYRFVEVFARSGQGSGPMDPALRARTHACLDDAGVPTSPDDRTDKEIFITAGKKHVDDVTDCMTAALRAEFPDREGIGVIPPPEVMES
jgi:hypothetical protein